MIGFKFDRIEENFEVDMCGNICYCGKKSLKIPKGGNQNPYIEEQT